MNRKKAIYFGLPVLGVFLGLWYIRAATCDVVYTDYIRLVNSYLPDVWNPDKFFVPDVLTRIPIHYVGRIVNTALFGYSTTFEMALGICGIGLAGLVFAGYCGEHKLSPGWYVGVIAVLFSLSQWEMMTNGTGWGHFLAFACFYYHYTVFDRVVHGREKTRDRLKLLLLPSLIILTVAGPYCAVYSATMVIFYLWVVFKIWMEQRKPGTVKSLREVSDLTERMRYWVIGCVSVMVPFFLYLWSNSYAVEDHAGAVNIPLLQVLAESPGFFVRFLLKALASVTVGGEILTEYMGAHGEALVYCLGALTAAAYLLALYGNFRYRLYERTVVPLMLLVAGMGNHAIVLVSRYIFLKENYGMSSRYALQYQVGILGILLTFGLLYREAGKRVARGVVMFFCLVFLAGWGVTNLRECRMAPHREHYAENIARVAVAFESVDDEVLRKTFDYRPGLADSGAKVRQALTILKEQGWNVFRP